MFVFSPYVRVVDGVPQLGPVPELAILDEQDHMAKRILREAKRAAVLEWQGEPDARAKLRRTFEELPTADLNVLALMWMISNRWNGATGQGGIWAMASRLVNESALEELRTRPMFEVLT